MKRRRKNSNKKGKKITGNKLKQKKNFFILLYKYLFFSFFQNFLTTFFQHSLFLAFFMRMLLYYLFIYLFLSSILFQKQISYFLKNEKKTDSPRPFWSSTVILLEKELIRRYSWHQSSSFQHLQPLFKFLFKWILLLQRQLFLSISPEQQSRIIISFLKFCSQRNRGVSNNDIIIISTKKHN